MAKSRVVLLTGGGRGLGRVMALSLLKAGHKVILSSTDQQSLDEVAEESGAGDRVATITANLAKPGEAEWLAEEASKIFGPVEALINNAGVSADSLRDNYLANPLKFWEATREQIEKFFAINSVAPMVLAGKLAPAMIERVWGRIIGNTTSLDTMLRMPLYGGSKAAQEAELSVAALSLAGTGVTANVLVPGGATGSRMTDRTGLSREDVMSDTIMAGPIAFLVSDEANDFNGRRILANLWDTSLPAKDAAAKASDVIAWTGFGIQGVQPKNAGAIFQR